MKSSLLTALVTLSLFTSPLPAQDAVADAQKLATNIETVISGGHWEKGDQDGTFRAIVLLEGWEHLSNRVLLQWIRRDGDNQELVVEKSIPIKEIPGEAGWRITSVEFVKTRNKAVLDSKVIIDTKTDLSLRVESETKGKATFVITPGVDHTYFFSRTGK